MQLLKFVINLIIGILCAIPLLYLMSVITSILLSSELAQQKLQAEGLLDNIYAKASTTALGKETADIMLTAPRGWKLVSSGKERENKLEVQNKCKEGECLCVCNAGLIKTDCIKNVICRASEKPFL